jgi:hypothetical protein
MRRPVVIATFVSMVFLGLFGYYAIRVGLYPVAIVNGAPLSAQRFLRTVQSVRHYYAQALTRYTPEQLGLSGPVTDQEVRRATLEKMIEDELVLKTLESTVGDTLSSLVSSKLASIDTAGSDFVQSVTTLYGLSVDEFREAVLIPQARSEILQESPAVQESGAEEWLSRAKAQASIRVFASDLAWDGSKVTVR